MRTSLKALILSFVVSLLAGCQVNPQTGEREINRTAVGAAIGTVAGGLIGAAVGGHTDAILIGAAAGAAVGGGTGYWMDKRAEQLKADLKDTGLEVQSGIDPSTGSHVLTVQAPADIAFPSGSADLQSAAFKGLSAVAEAVKSQPNARVEITGHTDSTGGQKLNELLSYARAESVAQYLYSAGVSNQATAVRGVASSMPIASNETAAGRALNRRVEIQIRQI